MPGSPASDGLSRSPSLPARASARDHDKALLAKIDCRSRFLATTDLLHTPPSISLCVSAAPEAARFPLPPPPHPFIPASRSPLL